jgi:hypothetical protein
MMLGLHCPAGDLYRINALLMGAALLTAAVGLVAACVYIWVRYLGADTLAFRKPLKYALRWLANWFYEKDVGLDYDSARWCSTTRTLWIESLVLPSERLRVDKIYLKLSLQSCSECCRIPTRPSSFAPALIRTDEGFSPLRGARPNLVSHRPGPPWIPYAQPAAATRDVLGGGRLRERGRVGHGLW